MASYSFNSCKNDVLSIINGNLTLNGITNATIDQYLWQGPVQGLNPSFPRSQYLAITYQGCLAICGGDKIALNEAPKALSIAGTWVFPLAILFCLPYDSLHRRKIRRTVEAISNWLGSPQTALTATVFNFRQIRECHRRTKEVNRDLQNIASNAFYVLSCLNQFELPEKPAERQQMLRVLIYGLFRPLSSNNSEHDVVLLQQLLSMMAHQLRMQRRRGIIPTFARLGTFLICFILSSVLAFGELGDITTAHSLALGLLVCWLPLLEAFTIVDRIPVSADRTRKLFHRWLHNVNAIRDWAQGQDPDDIPFSRFLHNVNTIRDWGYWAVAQGQDPDDIQWWATEDAGNEPFQLGDFIGQGRRMKYCGLTSAVIKETENFGQLFDSSVRSYSIVADRVSVRMQRRATSWWVVAGISLCVVTHEIMMAFMVVYTTPTVGLSCRSFSIIMFLMFTSVSWFLNTLWMTPPKLALGVSHLFNALAILSLLVIVVFQLTGAINNCYCKAAVLSMPFGLGGYIDFETADFYRKNFNISTFWTAGTALGALVPTIALVTSLFWWLKCKHLWSANERAQAYPFHTLRPSTEWLR